MLSLLLSVSVDFSQYDYAQESSRQGGGSNASSLYAPYVKTGEIYIIDDFESGEIWSWDQKRLTLKVTKDAAKSGRFGLLTILPESTPSGKIWKRNLNVHGYYYLSFWIKVEGLANLGSQTYGGRAIKVEVQFDSDGDGLVSRWWYPILPVDLKEGQWKRFCLRIFGDDKLVGGAGSDFRGDFGRRDVDQDEKPGTPYQPTPDSKLVNFYAKIYRAENSPMGVVKVYWDDIILSKKPIYEYEGRKLPEGKGGK